MSIKLQKIREVLANVRSWDRSWRLVTIGWRLFDVLLVALFYSSSSLKRKSSVLGHPLRPLSSRQVSAALKGTATPVATATKDWHVPPPVWLFSMPYTRHRTNSRSHLILLYMKLARREAYQHHFATCKWYTYKKCMCIYTIYIPQSIVLCFGHISRYSQVTEKSVTKLGARGTLLRICSTNIRS